MTAILGAGLSGLIAATQFPSAQVFEASGQDSIAHKAVLRFRSDSLSRLTGIPFRKVTVRKGIWYGSQIYHPSIFLANLYSKKTNGEYLDRSIWNLNSVERFIAPENLQEQLVDLIGKRIFWDTKLEGESIKKLAQHQPVISTIPLPAIYKMIHQLEPLLDFKYAGILVDRYRVKGADVFQTNYYPDPRMSVYRASITGSLLIVERVNRGSDEVLPWDEMLDVVDSFGLSPEDVTPIDSAHKQRYGKINPVDDFARRNMIFNLTKTENIFSLGRFAIWKNVLLDDVVNDVAVIRRLIQQGHYGLTLHQSNSTKKES